MPLDPNAPITYLTKFGFTIEIGGVVRAGFMKTGAVTMTTDKITIREGGNPFPVKMPGLSDFGDIKLERGMVAADFDLINWAEAVANSRTQTGLADGQYKRDIDLVLKNAAQVVQSRVRLFRTWVAEYEMGDLDTSASEVQMESITLTYEAMQKIPI